MSESYFHQDFDAEFGTADDVLRGFALRENPASVRDLLIEVDDVLTAGRNEVDLRTVWDPRDISAYEPAMHGMTYRQWFEHIREVLTSAGSLG